MSNPQPLSGRPQTPEEKALVLWFREQALASPEALEAAARTIASLTTALLGVFWGVMAIAETPLPSYLWLPWVRPLGAGAVLALLAALLCALFVVLPRRYAPSAHRLDEQQAAFEHMLAWKRNWLTASLVAFGLGMAALALVLLIALMRAV